MQNSDTSFNILNVHIDNNKIDALSLALSLTGISSLYKIFLEEENQYLDIEPKLYINRISEGSIDIFFELSRATSLFADSAICIKFINSISALISSLKDNNKQLINTLPQKKYEAVEQLLNATKNNDKSKMNLNIQKIDGNVYIADNITINGGVDTANINSTLKEIERHSKTKELTEHTEVTMRWASANFINNKSANNKVIIESISDSPKSVSFSNVEDQELCKSINENFPNASWHELLYIVDVKVLSIKNKINSYVVLKVYPNQTTEIDPNIIINES